MTQHNIRLTDFLSSHTTAENVVHITTEPDTIYLEQGREANYLNFDFIIQGLTDKNLSLRFLKVAVYDAAGTLLTYRYLNHNGVGIPGIHTLGKFNIKGQECFDLYNPFYQFPKTMPVHHLRYMFTFADKETHQEYYYGNIVVSPVQYQQQARLHIPLKGLMTIVDGHDYVSHHRRFGMSLVREVTHQQFTSNFSRYGLDFVLIGPDGNLSDIPPEAAPRHYDFHFDDARAFYTHNAPVHAPADGEVVAVVNNLDDLYDTAFNLDAAIQAQRVGDLAGNYVIIRHNEKEFSHLFHLRKSSIPVNPGTHVKQGALIGHIGFSGAATTYTHLHYQLMDGPHFLHDNALPCQFSNVVLLINGQPQHFSQVALDTSDFIVNAYT